LEGCFFAEHFFCHPPIGGVAFVLAGGGVYTVFRRGPRGQAKS
jgi:hypothetical protein